jgi:outer membrane lipoprotein-sorting protein
MICLRKRERALISVSLVLLVVACRSQNDSVATETSPSDTVVSSTPPFQTREPDRYRATRTITTVTADGKTVVTKTATARAGDMRRSESEVASKKVVYLEIPAGRFVLLPDDKVYADASEDANVEDDESLETSPERLLHVDGGSTSYQKLGTEKIEGRNANKYRITVNSSNAANVSVGETLIWIDEALQMPVRSETKSADGTRVTMALSDIQIEVDKRLFQVPDDYKKVAFSELRKLLRSD